MVNYLPPSSKLLEDNGGNSPDEAMVATTSGGPATTARAVEDADVVTYVVVCEPGEEAVSALTQFARAEQLEAAQITGVGAFERATVS